jgi:hypothetical protein
MYMTLAELLYCCTLSTARLVGQVEKNIQLFLALKCQMESMLGQNSSGLQLIFIAIGLRIIQQNPVIMIGGVRPTASANHYSMCKQTKLWVIAFDRPKD